MKPFGLESDEFHMRLMKSQPMLGPTTWRLTTPLFCLMVRDVLSSSRSGRSKNVGSCYHACAAVGRPTVDRVKCLPIEEYR